MKKILLALLFFWPLHAFATTTCYISEYSYVGKGRDNTSIPVQLEPSNTTQKIPYTTSTASAAFGSGTAYIRVVCDAKAYFAIGTAPVATLNSPYLVPDFPEYFALNTNGLKIAFYDGN